MVTVGFIGLGVMGRPMAVNLLKAGYPLVAHNRSRPPIDALGAAGAREADSPAAVARAADVVITMLPDTPDVERVLTGPAGVLEGVRPDTVIIDMSTIAPEAACALADEAARRGASLLDAPVSGGEVGAIAGTLSIMVGGNAAALERVRPILEVVGAPDHIVHVGVPGAGQLCKACNQIVVGGTLAAVAEALTLARKAGVDPGRVREALLGGFASSRVLDVHGDRMIRQEFTPGFRAALHQKDMGIAIDAARRLGVAAPVSAIVLQLLNAAVAAGRGHLDHSVLSTVILELAGLHSEVESA